MYLLILLADATATDASVASDFEDMFASPEAVDAGWPLDKGVTPGAFS